MREPLQPMSFHLLAYHQQRRDRGVPTLSVLVGPPAEGTVLWRGWALACGRESLHVHVTEEIDPFEAAARQWVSRPSVLARLIACLSPELAIPSRRLRDVLGGEACQERDNMVEHLISHSPSHSVEQVCRFLLAGSGHEPAAWNEQETRLLLEGLSAVEGPEAPGLLFICHGAPDKTARSLTDLIELCPRVPMGWAVSATDYALALDDEAPSRVTAVCREGIIAWNVSRADRTSRESGPNAGSHPEAGTQAMIRDLVKEGASESLLHRWTKAVEASKKAHEGPDAAERARSAAEEFLFQVLEIRPETAGLFELNGRVRAEWGPHGEAEVDLLCRSRNVAVEIDGYYHFGDPDRYRRDRQKDVVLQRLGFLVLRFLADDVMVGLETILDTIRASLDWRHDEHRRRGKSHE